MIANVFQDVAFALRMLRNAPGFTFVAVLTMAVGIGINVAIYTVVHSVLLSALPYPASDRLVAISETVGADSVWPTSYPDYLDWKAMQHSFDEIAVSRRDDFNLSGNGEPERFSGLFVTASYFRVLKVPPKLGRAFYDEEDFAAGANPVILTEHLWRSRFGADPAIIGRKLTFNTITYEVVGVTDENFSISSYREGFHNVDLYAPFGFYANWPYIHDRNFRFGFYGIARLKQGVSLDQATADLKVIAKNLELKYPASNAGFSVKVRSLRDSILGKFRAMLWLLEAAVVLLLLITCANIAGLMLVRTGAREKEIAMRAALGATRSRLISQLLTESAVLAALGGTLGCLIACWSKNAITSLCPNDLPRLQEIRLDTSVLAFSALTTLGASLIFGLGPAWKLSKSELVTISKSTGGSHRPRSQAALIIGQVTLACLLLTGAGLLVQTFRALQNEPLGFDPYHLLAVGIKLPRLKYFEDIQQATFQRQLVEKIAALPGVKAAATDSDAPFSGGRFEDKFFVTGQPQPRHGEEPIAETHDVSPDYFKTMGMPILRGRSFSPEDALDKPRVVVIDENLAQHFFPNRDPIGEQLNDGKTQFKIVGIVPSVRHGQVGLAPKIPQLYWPEAQSPDLQVTLLVRTEGEPTALLASVRSVVRALDNDVPIFAPHTMSEAVSDSLGRQRISATLITGFSILALFLAALGLYGVLAYSVTQRTREIGIRIALGSPRSKIFGLIVRGGMAMVCVGILVGLTLTLACGPLIQHFVYGVAPHDIAAIVGAALLLLGVAVVACWLPARRAVRIDPLIALRQE